MTALHTIDDVACPACGCVCDDLRVRISANRIIQIEPVCPRAERWFAARAEQNQPSATINGTPVTNDEAIARAAEILAQARCPMILGHCQAIEDQRAAIALAERIGAALDFGSDLAPTLAMQQVGQSTCTLGEVRQRADLILYCGCDPAVTHPRLAERYFPVHVPELINPEFAALQTLRLLVAGKQIAAEESLVRLAARMNAARFGVIFFGSLPPTNCEALLQLVTDLNKHTRFYARRLHTRPGCNNVIAWQTGYPGAVRFEPNGPRFGPGEFTASHLLARHEADACLLLSDDVLADLPSTAIERLKALPVIRLNHEQTDDVLKCEVHIATAVRGLHLGGTAVRMDDISIPLKTLLDSELPSLATVLEAISRQVPAAARC